MPTHPGGLRKAPFLLFFSLLLFASCAPEVDVEKLFVQSNSDDYEERVEARQRIASLVEKGSVEPFARGLKSHNAETRLQSILNLLAIKNPESKKPLVGELELSRRFNVFYNPIRLVPVASPSDSRIMIANILRMKGGDPGAVPILAEAYGKEPDVAARVGTVFALGALHDPAAAETLKKALKDDDLKVVQAAVEGLTMISDPDIAKRLLEGLTDPREEIRANCASALSGYQDPGVKDALLHSVLKDSSMKVRMAALDSLPSAGGFPAFPTILAILKDPHTPTELREESAKALQSLTGQDFGQDAARWSAWWEKNKAKLVPKEG